MLHHLERLASSISSHLQSPVQIQSSCFQNHELPRCNWMGLVERRPMEKPQLYPPIPSPLEYLPHHLH